MIHDSQEIGQRLLAGRPDGDSRVRARLREQHRECLRNRAAISSAMQFLDHVKRAAHFENARGWLAFQFAKRMKACLSLAEFKQRAVGEREDRPAHRREDQQLVIGTFDRAEQIADRDHFLALVE